MFLNKEIKHRIKGTILVPFCKDCSSQDIRYVCNKCGSHNITTDWTDKRSQRQEVEEYEVSIYKCDLCGKEFDGLKVDNYISYADGGFEPCNYNNFTDAENIHFTNYQLPQDLCSDCKDKLGTYLTLKLIAFTSTENVNKLITEFINAKKGVDTIDRDN